MKKDYFGMILLGIFTNIPYWVVFTNCQLICKHFHKEGILGILTLSIVLLGMFATSINTFLTSKNVSYKIRTLIESFIMVIGLTGVAFSPNIYMCVDSIVISRFSGDFGEGLLLGYAAARGRDDFMATWGIGSGLSGIIGASYAFITQFYKVPYKINFLAVEPVSILYYLTFYFIVDIKGNKGIYDNVIESKGINDQQDLLSYEHQNLLSHEHDNLMVRDDSFHEHDDLLSHEHDDLLSHEHQNLINHENDKENDLTFCSGRLWKEALPFFLNNGMTFFFQYACISGFNECSMTPEEKKHKAYIYQLLNVIYQLGNATGRSTLRFFRIPYLFLLTSIQGIFCTLWCLNSIFKFMNLPAEIAAMLGVGLNSGLSYINVFKQTMNYKANSRKEKEMITNITTISFAGFIALSSIFTLIYENTFLKKYCLK